VLCKGNIGIEIINAPFREDMQKTPTWFSPTAGKLTVSWLEKSATIRLVKGD
jgi:hypothetical protein